MATVTGVDTSQTVCAEIKYISVYNKKKTTLTSENNATCIMYPENDYSWIVAFI